MKRKNYLLFRSKKTPLSTSWFLPIFLLLLILFPKQARSQNNSEPALSFVYATGYVTSNKSIKVLLINSHILTFKSWEQQPGNSEVLHTLGFNVLVDEIRNDEYIQGENAYDNIAFNAPVVEQIDHVSVHYSDKLKYNISSSDSPLDAIKKLRTGIIEEHRRQGYKVYQVDFQPENYEQYTYLKDGDGWHPSVVLRQNALSPTYVSFYRKGEIKAQVAALLSEKNEQNSGITVESKAKSENPSTPSKKSEINYVIIAQDLERQGDAFVRSEGAFSKNALAKYREAYYYAPTEELRAKIANVTALEDASAAAGAGAVALGNTFDQWNIPEFIGLQIAYSGGMEVEASPGVISKPYNVELLTVNYRIIAYQFGFSYSSSPTYQYSLQNQNLNPVSLSPAEFSVQSINATIGIGLGIPFKSFAIYGMYGAEFPLSSDYTLLSTQYTPASDFKDSFQVKLSPFIKFGLNAKIPKTKIALGAQYTLRTVKSENILELGKVNTEFKQVSQIYYLNEPLHDSYKYGLLGLNLTYVY